MAVNKDKRISTDEFSGVKAKPLKVDRGSRMVDHRGIVWTSKKKNPKLQPSLYCCLGNSVKQIEITATFLLPLSRLHLDPFGPKNEMLSQEDLRRVIQLIDLFRIILRFRNAHDFRDIFASNVAGIKR